MRRSESRWVLAVCVPLVIGVGCGGSDTEPSPTADAAPVDTTDAVDTATDTSPTEVGETVEEDTHAPVTIVVEALADGQVGEGTPDNPYRDLQHAIDQAPDGATLQIGAGTYEAVAQPYADPGCGNCSDADFFDGCAATRGFYVTGKGLQLIGAGQAATVLVTNAGYGLLFEQAGDSSVQHLKVTGGLRDADGKATDAGIVVMHTQLLVENVAVVENDNLYTGPEPDPVVGVGGIFGREGSSLTLRNCVVEDNSWDGITLYRGLPGDDTTAPVAHVEGNRVGCNSQCVNPRGRGAGIAATWNSSLVAIDNEVHHYWKGIGAFGESIVLLHNNVVRDQGGWGVIVTGTATMYAYNNVVVRNGTTGIAAWNMGVAGAFVNNIVAGNGTSPDEWVGIKTGFWMNSMAPAFRLEYNLGFDNANFIACIGGNPNQTPCSAIPFDGVDGNISLDPLFVSDTDFHLQPGSPAIDSGDPTILDVDATRSDMGVYGGSHAKP